MRLHALRSRLCEVSDHTMVLVLVLLMRNV